MLTIFSYVYICMSSLEKFLFSSSAHILIVFVFLMLSCMSCFYVLEIEKDNFIPITKKGSAKECSKYCTIALISHASKVMPKIFSNPDFNST